MHCNVGDQEGEGKEEEEEEKEEEEEEEEEDEKYLVSLLIHKHKCALMHFGLHMNEHSG